MKNKYMNLSSRFFFIFKNKIYCGNIWSLVWGYPPDEAIKWDHPIRMLYPANQSQKSFFFLKFQAKSCGPHIHNGKYSHNCELNERCQKLLSNVYWSCIVLYGNLTVKCSEAMSVSVHIPMYHPSQCIT